MDYKITNRTISYNLSTALSDEGNSTGRHIIVGRRDESSNIEFLYFGENIEEAVSSIEDETGHIVALREHVAEYWNRPGFVSWSEETLLLDARHMYVVTYLPVLDAECDLKESLCDSIEEALAEAKSVKFACGGEVSMATLSGVTLYERSMGEKNTEFLHSDLDNLRHLEADRRSYQISGDDKPAPEAQLGL